MFLKKINVAVHDSSFHADDVFAVAILRLHLKKRVNRHLVLVTFRKEQVSTCSFLHFGHNY